MFESLNREGTHSVKWDEAPTKFGRDDLLPLWVADMDLASPQCVQDAMQKRALHPIYGYSIYPSSYYSAIENWMLKRFDFKIKKEWIVPCYGVVASLNFAIDAYTKKGDGIIVQTPIYPPFVNSIKDKRRTLLENTLIYDEGRYKIDFSDFEKKAKEAKLFLLCSPHNPTGRTWNEDELMSLIDICRTHNVLIVSDEIHADVVYEKIFRSLGSFQKIQEHCILFNAPSKTFNIAGLNTSYAIIPNALLRKSYENVQEKSGMTNGNPFGIEALIAAYTMGDKWLDTLKLHLKSNINYVKMRIEKKALAIKVVPTEATYLIWLDCRHLAMTQKALVNFFVEEAKLGLNDGLSFGKAGEGFMRLNIGTSRAVIEEAMTRIIAAIDERNEEGID